MENKKKSTVNYIHGNAARRLEAVPKKEWQKKEKKQKKELSRSARINREKASQMSMGYVMFLAVVTVAVAAVCFQYLRLRADISDTNSNIAKLTTSIDTLTDQNDAIDYSINSYTDVDYIIGIATQELGMVKASKDQVSYYQGTESEYMKQFTDVPEE